MMGDYQVRFCERLAGESPACLLGGSKQYPTRRLTQRQVPTAKGAPVSTAGRTGKHHCSYRPTCSEKSFLPINELSLLTLKYITVSLSKTFDRIKYIDDLIRRKATGDPEVLAGKLNLSESHTRHLITELKELGFPIEYSRKLNSYYYTREGRFIQKLLGNDLSDDRMRGITGGKTFLQIFSHADYISVEGWRFVG